MNIIIHTLVLFLFTNCAQSKETIYTASTPAAPVIINFLEIPSTDSVDFIRWKLKLNDGHYTLLCNYGISKANTNGFINGGNKISFSGNYKKENDIVHLLYMGNELKLIELNTNLLHLLHADNSLLVGNGGWSFTLNNKMPAVTDELKLISIQPVLKDSMVFDGRSPCAVPGFGNKNCYKLKWRITLYANKLTNEPTTYKLLTANWLKDGVKSGIWKMLKTKDGHVSYRLYNDSGETVLHLLMASENILLFTDAQGNLLTGDEDFSYTLNRKE